MKEHFRSVEEYPESENANGVVMRLIDGLGYRFYWATEGLAEADYAFSPGKKCMSIGEVVGHVWGLANWIHGNLLGAELERPDALEAQRDAVFEILGAIRSFVEGLTEEEMFRLEIRKSPFWHLINGPLSDALTHTGQIAAFRRLNGNPVPKHSVFTAKRP